MMRTMQRSYFVGLTVLVSMVLAAVMAGSSVAAPGGPTRVSVDSFGNQADEGPQGSYETSISADGRYVAFTSNASGLVSLSCGPNLAGDVFVRDRQTKTIEWVSVDNCGTEANGDSWYSSISDDGRYVAFDSFSSNLVPGDTNDSSDVFVRDRQPETTQPKDCSAPTTTRMLSPQPNAAGWNNSDVGITLNATDTGGSGLKEIRYSINGGEPMIVQQSSVQIPITSEGSTTISYHSTDNAGNVEPLQTFTVKIDKSAPSVSTQRQHRSSDKHSDGHFSHR
jgi:Chitobiase/beta-hexosaminidase C-terminal domain